MRLQFLIQFQTTYFFSLSSTKSNQIGYQENLRIISAFKGRSLKMSMLLKWRNFFPFLPRSGEKEIFLGEVSSKIKKGLHEDFRCQFEAVQVISVSLRSRQLRIKSVEFKEKGKLQGLFLLKQQIRKVLWFSPCSFQPNKSSIQKNSTGPGCVSFCKCYEHVNLHCNIHNWRRMPGAITVNNLVMHLEIKPAFQVELLS